MSAKTRQGNRTDRRLAPAGFLTAEDKRQLIARLAYAGSGYHKLGPGDYGFKPSHSPRPSKSVCDDLRPILKEEAASLLRSGINHGMVSHFSGEETPKYIWALDEFGEVYEAKVGPNPNEYHGYRLGNDEIFMRRYIEREWRLRCQQD